MHHVNLNALRVFVIVAEHGSFQRAGEALNLSRGAVSLRIKQLEHELGTVLLVRGPRGVSLTPAGDRIRSAMCGALSILETALTDVVRDEARITLHIGASFATKWLMPRMTAFKDRFPAISLATETHTEPMARALGQGEIAVVPATQDVPVTGQQMRHLTELKLAAVCHPDMERPSAPITLEALLRLPLLQDAHKRWDRLITDHAHLATSTPMNFERSALALDAAINGHGVAIAPAHMTEMDLRAGRLVQIWAPPRASGEHLYLACSNDASQGRHVRRVINWMLEEFGQDAIPVQSAPLASG